MSQDAYQPLEVLTELCPSLAEDVLMALRFLYYVKARPVVPDALYDALEMEYLTQEVPDDSPLLNPGSDNPADYEDHVKALAFYLSFMGWKMGNPIKK